ncbi:MAG: MerR family DNA-binding protein, partial [Actinomycetota bacterium]|nr:MerR family DNA-binding protein [Actinomycetota bacterium]
EAGSAPCQHVRGMLRQQVRTISQRITELRRLRDELRALDAVIDEIPDGEGAFCRIIEHTRRTADEVATAPLGSAGGRG